MKNIMKYVKENKLFLLVLIIGMVLLFTELNQVIMYADDYSLGIESNKYGIEGTWIHFVNNYLHWGGGYTGSIVIAILTIGFKYWKFIELVLITAIVLMTMRLIHVKDGKYKELTTIFIWLLYFLIDISTSRETILWLDGSMAYVFTSFQVILYTYLLYTRIHYPKMRKKYDIVLFPLAAFFGGWSSAQSGAIVVLITGIEWIFAKVINKIKINKFYFISSLLTIIGYCIFFFAPGNGERMEVQGLFTTLGLLSKIMYKASPLYSSLFDIRNYQFFGLPFYTILLIILLLVVTKHLLKNETNEKIKLLLSLGCIYNSIFVLTVILTKIPILNNYSIISNFLTYNNLYYEYIGNKLSIADLFPYVISTITIIIIIIQALYISVKEKNSLLFIVTTCGLVSQAILLVAPTHPSRTTLISIMFFIIGIVYLFKYSLDNKIEWEYYISIIFMILFLPVGVVLLAVFYLINDYLKDLKANQKLSIKIATFIIILSLFAFKNWAETTHNYKVNKEIDAKNMVRIEKYQKNPSSEKILVLIEPKEPAYGFTGLAGIEWVEKAVITYFELDENTDIMFEDEYKQYKKSKIIRVYE